MEAKDKQIITIKTIVNAPISEVWKHWTTPESIVSWNNASPDWHTPKAENDMRVGGKFNYRMEAKDGSFGFDFWGIYDIILINKQISITLGDERRVETNFTELGEKTEIIELFEAESQNSIELQKTGWQAILDNFKKFVEEK